MKIKSLVKLGLGAITATVLLSGCAVDEFARKYSPDNVGKMLMDSMSGKNAENMKKDFKDSYLAEKFSPYYDKDGHTVEYTSNSIQITKQLVYFSQNVYMKDAFGYVRNNAAETEITKEYKNAIVERGNIYKVYTGTFNKKIVSIVVGNSNLPEFNRDRMNYIKWDLVPLIVEYNPQGELISVMMSKVEIGAAYDQVRNPNVQSEIEMTTLLYVDNALNPIRYNVSKKDWEDNLIFEYKK